MYLQSFKLMIPFSELFPWPNICKVQKSPNCGLAFVLYDLSSLLSNQLISDFIFSFRSSHNLFLPASAFSIISSLWINYEKKIIIKIQTLQHMRNSFLHRHVFQDIFYLGFSLWVKFEAINFCYLYLLILIRQHQLASWQKSWSANFSLFVYYS